MAQRAAPLLHDCTGVLVAGGRARRMGGVPKGLLRVSGEPIVARSVRLLRSLFADVLLVANDPAPYLGLRVRIVPDSLPGKGAPGGVHAALAAASTAWIFTVGCDMPFLSADPILALAGWRGGAPAVLVRWEGRLEPLHAFWSRACLPLLDRMLRAGDPSLAEVAGAAGADVVPEERWRRVDPGGHAFANVNTPEEAARLGVELPPA